MISGHLLPFTVSKKIDDKSLTMLQSLPRVKREQYSISIHAMIGCRTRRSYGIMHQPIVTRHSGVWLPCDFKLVYLALLKSTVLDVLCYDLEVFEFPRGKIPTVCESASKWSSHRERCSRLIDGTRSLSSRWTNTGSANRISLFD